MISWSAASQFWREPYSGFDFNWFEQAYLEKRTNEIRIARQLGIVVLQMEIVKIEDTQMQIKIFYE